RRVLDGGLAASLLVLSSPLWLVLGWEARVRGLEPLLKERRVGRSRRNGPRRAHRLMPAIDRRSIERRTQDLMGEPIVCSRFRTDLGAVSRWVGRHRLDKLPFLFNVLR